MNISKWFFPFFLVFFTGSVFAKNLRVVTVTLKDPEHLCQTAYNNGLYIDYSYVATSNSNPNNSFFHSASSPWLVDGSSFTVSNNYPNSIYTEFYISGEGNNCGNLTYTTTGGTCDRNLSKEFPQNTANIMVTVKKAPLKYDPTGGFTLDCQVSGS